MSRRSRAIGRSPRGLRFLVLMGATLALVGVAGHYIAWPLLASTLGPTAYVFASHPDSESARRHNAIVGHSVAITSGLACLAAFGLWNRPSIALQGHLSLSQVGAAALAGGLTIAVLEMLGTHHAPAAATTLLIATGIAKPGPPLYGLMVGLGLLILIGPPLARWFPLAANLPEAKS